MSRAGTPTDNGAMEAINGWVKPEMFVDFGIGDSEDVPKAVEEYIRFFNKARSSYAHGYLISAQFKERYAGKPNQPKKPSKVAYERRETETEKANAEKTKKGSESVYFLLTSTRASHGQFVHGSLEGTDEETDR